MVVMLEMSTGVVAEIIWKLDKAADSVMKESPKH